MAIEPGVPCRRCAFCKAGRYNLCADVRFCATPPIDGSLARYYVHAADFCFKLAECTTLRMIYVLVRVVHPHPLAAPPLQASRPRLV